MFWSIQSDGKMTLTVRNDDRVFPLDRLVSNSFGQVDSQQHRVHLPADRVERSLKEDCSVDGKLHVVGTSLVIVPLQTYGRCCRSSCLLELRDSYREVVSTHVNDRLAARGLLSRSSETTLLTAFSSRPRRPWCRAPFGLGRSLCWMRSALLS
jgi:hypothetical protein